MTDGDDLPIPILNISSILGTPQQKMNRLLGVAICCLCMYASAPTTPPPPFPTPVSLSSRNHCSLASSVLNQQQTADFPRPDLSLLQLVLIIHFLVTACRTLSSSFSFISPSFSFSLFLFLYVALSLPRPIL